MKCRFCQEALSYVFVDLVNSPPSNSFLNADQLNEPEVFFPLKVFVCHNCFLVQIDEYKKSDAIFNNEYVYFSSYSQSWLKHCKAYVERMIIEYGFNQNSHIIEVASNDGYLLQYFKEKGVQVTGIEPTANTAKVALDRGIPTIVDFFGTALANTLHSGGIKADLILGNNVLAHVPDINDFVEGLKILLGEQGIITMEFPHLLQLIANNQFDTIYHEHFSYLSLLAVKQIFEAHRLELFDVDEIPTHGGSLRIYAKHQGNAKHTVSKKVKELLAKEHEAGVASLDYYSNFSANVQRIKLDFLSFLIEQKDKGKVVGAYGAAAKGNTLLNYCGVRNDVIAFVADANPHKQHKYLPGSHIPVVNELYLKEVRPDFVIIFPWNIKDEIMDQLSYIREWDGKFVIPVPMLQIL